MRRQRPNKRGPTPGDEGVDKPHAVVQGLDQGHVRAWGVHLSKAEVQVNSEDDGDRKYGGKAEVARERPPTPKPSLQHSDTYICKRWHLQHQCQSHPRRKSESPSHHTMAPAHQTKHSYSTACSVNHAALLPRTTVVYAPVGSPWKLNRRMPRTAMFSTSSMAHRVEAKVLLTPSTPGGTCTCTQRTCPESHAHRQSHMRRVTCPESHAYSYMPTGRVICPESHAYSHKPHMHQSHAQSWGRV
jgi:hypothetical protein